MGSQEEGQMANREEMREKAESIEDDENKDQKDQMASERITSNSGFHSVSQTVIQTGCSCELP